MGSLQHVISRGIQLAAASGKLVRVGQAVQIPCAFNGSQALAFFCRMNHNQALKDGSKKSHVVKVLEDAGVVDPFLVRGVLKSLQKQNLDAHNLKSTIEILSSITFSPQTSAEMIKLYPGLVSLDPSQIYSAWDTWSTLVGQGALKRDLIWSVPWLLAENPSNIVEKFEHLRAVVTSPKYVVQILKNCPQIMLQSMDEFRNVCNYLSVVMFVRNVAEYYKSSVLGLPLSEVIARHVFLERCGKYKRPNPRHKEEVPSGNPTLSQIYDTSPEEFATKIAGVTLEELIVFEDLFESEMEDILRKYDDDSGSEYESDLEDESD